MNKIISKDNREEQRLLEFVLQKFEIGEFEFYSRDRMHLASKARKFYAYCAFTILNHTQERIADKLGMYQPRVNVLISDMKKIIKTDDLVKAKYESVKGCFQID